MKLFPVTLVLIALVFLFVLGGLLTRLARDATPEPNCTTDTLYSRMAEADTIIIRVCEPTGGNNAAGTES